MKNELCAGRWEHLLFCFVMLVLANDAPAKELHDPISTVFDASGRITSLIYDSNQMLQTGTGPILIIGRNTRHPVKVTLAPAAQKLPAHTYKQVGDGIEVVTQTHRTRSTVDLAITYKNTGTTSIDTIDYTLCDIHFPRRPLGEVWKEGNDCVVDTETTPAMVAADWGTGKLLLCMPFASGTTSDAQGTIGTTIMGFMSGKAVTFRTAFKAGLQPSKSWTFHASLRLARSEVSNALLAKDIFEQFVKANPMLLKWPDRRPIGSVGLTAGRVESTINPRSYLAYLRDPKLDVTTVEGKKELEDRLMEVADKAIASLKQTGAQGMFCWDIEGDAPFSMSIARTNGIGPRQTPTRRRQRPKCCRRRKWMNCACGIRMSSFYLSGRSRATGELVRHGSWSMPMT